MLNSSHKKRVNISQYIKVNIHHKYYIIKFKNNIEIIFFNNNFF
jgi:hypothetical protein